MKEEENQYPSVKEVLRLLSLGVILMAAIVIAPGLGGALRYYSRSKWRKYSRSYLRRTVKRMLDRELVSIREISGKSRIVLTEKGKQRALEFSLDELKIAKQDSNFLVY